MFVLLLTEKKFNCQVCDRSYSNKRSLNQHMKIHDESKAFKCDICMKIFPSKSKLELHCRTHTGEKPFACRICDKKFAREDYLVKHQSTHSDVRSFTCSICPEGRSFKTKDGLTNHLVFHYEPKFACSRCDFKAHRKYSLDRHLKIHKKKIYMF